MQGAASSYPSPLLLPRTPWLSGLKLRHRFLLVELLWDGETEMSASSLLQKKSQRFREATSRPLPQSVCLSPLLPKALGILGVCPKAPVHPLHPPPPRIHSQEGFSKEPAPTHMLSTPAPVSSGQSQILLVWNSRFHPLFSTRPLLQELKSCHSSPKLQELLLPCFHSPCPHPLQESSSCCGECPSPSLSWQRFS